ncbi:Mbeg1-like protein [Streptococcus suis]|uniref:Mbeg1-like protein n=1 Tax=Streptococcus suis TaxID=1307 RepID=UPI000411C4C6|nr:Mbeg1-like protein [Streptococcus suis]
MTEKYTDRDRQKIANKEYSAYKFGDEVNIGTLEHPRYIGTVRKVLKDATGLDGYVVEEPDGNVTVLFQGSKGPGKEGVAADWMDNDLPMAHNIISNKSEVTPQLQSASRTLNQVLKDYPNAQITVYGHSLGSMNAQYALATVSDIDRIAGAYIYNGPNVYPALTEAEKARVNALKYRIHNYIDQKDFVPIGYSGKDTPGYKSPAGTSEGAIGIVYRVDSKTNLNPIDQHVWGGYQWNADGSLKVKEGSSKLEQHYSNALHHVSSEMYHYATLKATLSRGGFSSRETIYLDSEQARILAQGLVKVAETTHQTLEKETTSTLTEVNEVYSSLGNVPFGFILSPDEVRQAYSSAGVDYHSLVGDSTNQVEKFITRSNQLKQDLVDLESQIQAGIEQKVTEDQTLAQRIQEWTSTIN